MHSHLSKQKAFTPKQSTKQATAVINGVSLVAKPVKKYDIACTANSNDHKQTTEQIEDQTEYAHPRDDEDRSSIQTIQRIPAQLENNSPRLSHLG